MKWGVGIEKGKPVREQNKKGKNDDNETDPEITIGNQ